MSAVGRAVPWARGIEPGISATGLIQKSLLALEGGITVPDTLAHKPEGYRVATGYTWRMTCCRAALPPIRSWGGTGVGTTCGTSDLSLEESENLCRSPIMQVRFDELPAL